MSFRATMLAARISTVNTRICNGRPRHEPPRRGAHRLDAGRGPRRLPAAVQRPAVSRAASAPRELRAEPGASQHVVVGQDGRLPGRLQVLPAERALRHRPRPRRVDAGSRCGRGRAGRQGTGCNPVLHGGGVSQPEAKAARTSEADGARSARTGPGDLRNARHVDAAAGRRAQGRRARLLQSQPRHVARVLWRSHHDAHLPGSPRYVAGGARCRPQRLLRRHPRHG